MYKQVKLISVVEIEKAEKEVFKVVQRQRFREEVSQVDERKNRSETRGTAKKRVSQLRSQVQFTSWSRLLSMV